MGRTVAYVAGLVVWTFAVFVGTFWATFPSDTLARRLEYEVPRILGDRYVADIGSVSPWWVGLSVHDVKLYEQPRTPPRRGRRALAEEAEGEDAEEAEAGPKLVAMLANARVRASLWSLIRRAPYVSGAVRLTDGEIAYAVGTAADEQGAIGLSDLEVTADALPLSDLMVLLPVTATGTGALDIDIDLQAGENGMRDASGRISISGSDLALSEVELPTIGNLGMDVPIRSLKLEADIQEGRATLGQTAIDSELFQLGITGEVTLREPLDRSAVDLTITLSQLADNLAAYGTFLSAAETGSGTYQYNCRGVISRLNAYSCTPGGSRDRAGRMASRASRGGTVAMPAGRDPVAEEERQRRREELRARLQQRREEREARQRSTRPEAFEDEPVLEDPDEEFLLPEDEEEGDEELLEEDLPPEEWDEEVIE